MTTSPYRRLSSGEVSLSMQDCSIPDRVGAALAIGGRRDLMEINIDAAGEVSVAFEVADDNGALYEMSLKDFRELFEEAEMRTRQWRERLIEESIWTAT